MASLFERLSIPVYYADQRAKALMTENQSLRAAISQRFGSDIYQYLPSNPQPFQEDRSHFNTQSDGYAGTACRGKGIAERKTEIAGHTLLLNRKKLADLIFSDPQALQDLEALVHPAVAQDSLGWHLAQTQAPYTLHEAAITYEIGGQGVFDAMIVVSAPEAIRLQRSMQRDQASEQNIRDRMAKQWPEEKKIALADFVIVNDGLQLLFPQVLKIHHQLLRWSTI